MPPFLPRKRLRSPSPQPSSPSTNRAVKASKPRPSVFETLDAERQVTRTVEENKAYLASFSDDGDSDSSLSELDSDEFEDVLPSAKRRKVEGEDTDEEMDWEDAIPDEAHREHHEPSDTLNIILSRADDEEPSSVTLNTKKGPSKKERVIRVQTHCLHVTHLMWHNSIRNSWVNDKEVQEILVDGLSEGLKTEVTKWRRAMGYNDRNDPASNDTVTPTKSKGKGKAKARAKGQDKKVSNKDRIRDWGADASKLEPGTPNLSRGDPLLRLLTYLSAYWKKRFRVTAPGLRKLGYRSAFHLHSEVTSFVNDEHDPTRHGEKVVNLEEFRILAKKCEGSRDVGAQLFTALLRGLGLDARLIASLQPSGFGWSKAEDAKPRKNKIAQTGTSTAPVNLLSSEDDSDLLGSESGRGTVVRKPKNTKPKRTPSIKQRPAKDGNTKIASETFSLDESEEELFTSDQDGSDVSTGDTTSTRFPTSKSPVRKFDKDLRFPVYWTEVLSPVSNCYYPVSTLINPNVATSPEHYSAFEPRGTGAENAKQVICYVTAFSADGTAKDVTVRYLKRHQLPGKTKGFRLPPEKTPIYNQHGKILKYENYDWFKRVMSVYARSSDKRTLADDLEEHGDLVPLKTEKATKDGTDSKGVETLQGYKSSAEFVLERHLRREEAILPNAKIVKYFSSGKGDKVTKDAVYLRKDIVPCKTVESWHKEGRQIKKGEHALKHVPIRAVTIIRKREIEDSTRETGEKPTQGLYSKEQTEWIIPPPIENGKIPRNAFGNIDVYVPSMVPQGAVHVRLKGTAKLCKRMGIDFAEACTGFEFGKQRAVPVLTGVVVAEEHEDRVRDAWRAEEKIKKEKEDVKRVARSLSMWKKFMFGLRTVERMKAEYGVGGELPDEANPFTKNQKAKGKLDDHLGGGEEEGEEGSSNNGPGGFLLPDQEDEDGPIGGGGFLLDSDDEVDAEPDGGGFEIDHGRTEAASHVAKTDRTHAIIPISMQSAFRVASPVATEASDAESPVADNTVTEHSPEEESNGSESDNYAPAKAKRGEVSRRGGAGRVESVKPTAIASTRPKRSAATSSPYFRRR